MHEEHTHYRKWELLCGQVSLTTLELKRLKVSLLQTSSDPLQCKSALCFSKKRNVVYINMGFPGGASGKEPTCQCRRLREVRSIPGLGRSSGEGNSTLSMLNYFLTYN